ncbi:hypothetical protein [Streptomyces sp. NBC_01471]|uniref:hypothetical protein n=1 Tax=Streptomyces sp. NBC_01471 TaxID=2903879 RepID=UPI00352FC5C0
MSRSLNDHRQVARPLGENACPGSSRTLGTWGASHPCGSHRCGGRPTGRRIAWHRVSCDPAVRARDGAPTPDITLQGLSTRGDGGPRALRVLLVPYGGLLAAGLRAGETLLVGGATGNSGSAAVAVAPAMGAGRRQQAAVQAFLDESRWAKTTTLST